MELADALRKSQAYFREKIEQHGAVPQGVDFNGPEAQSVRFSQLVRILDSEGRFSLLDYGCGYGALLAFLRSTGRECVYWGYDELDSMILAARSEVAESDTVHFTSSLDDVPICDYLVAGSIFNIKFDVPPEIWREHTLIILRKMDQLCTKGFAFDMLTSYSDPERMGMRPDLYFADPLYYFDFCKRTFARDVALLHDYRLFDFTILVRKQF
jgi:SAM-dependent methyltransferase